MTSITYRPFAGIDDFPAMVVCANASFAADGLDSVRRVDEMVRDYAAFTSCVPARDVWIAEAGSEIAGYVRGWHWEQADGLRLYGQLGFVAPQWRRQGVGTALLAWLEGRQREMAAEHPAARAHAHHAFVQESETARAALLARHGYHRERAFFSMVRPTLRDIPGFELPPGIVLRQVQPDHHRAIWDAHVAAFATHWGWSPPKDDSDYQWWLKSPLFQPHLWQIAWDVETNEVAGQVRAYIDASYNTSQGRKRGWTEFISVGRKWRRRGIARALIAHSLRAQKAAGMTESGLSVDGNNHDGATRVYEDCGFRVVKRNWVYRKAFDLIGI
ncbi:GNAT family N-acetyltransferase [Ramlibacter sp.]|uniref:GNAT family N-acetyltransferase n=1 Tax=Ramlibacter sp. TaxID=1917967 RepID=UPI003D119027